jgi:hypothetical protein
MDEYKKCSVCQSRTLISEFTIKKGITLKSCNRCLERSRIFNNLKCEHGKRKRRCVECGGSEFCKHKKAKNDCIECKGSSICEHERRRRNCVDCKGSGVCEHNRDKSRCVDCKGSRICQHNKDKRICRLCSDPTHITIRGWLYGLKYEDIKKNRYNEQEFITYEYCEFLIEESKNQCCYCACELQMIERKSDMLTIERIDNSIGHIIGNCKIACFHCNVSHVGGQ